MKRFGIGLGIVVLLVIAALVVLSLSINRVVEKGVETFGPRLTKTSVTLEGVDISALSGSGELRGLLIGNPEGFQTDAAIKLARVKVVIVPQSVFSDRVRVTEVLIDGPEITYETSGGGTNIARIMANIKAAGSGRGEKTSGEAKAGKKIEIDDLVIRNGTIRLSSSMLKGKAVTVPLPEIRLENIGKEGDGAQPAEVVGEVFAALNQAVAGAVAKSGELLGKGAESVLEGGQQAGERLKEGVSGFFKGLSDTLSGEGK